MPPFAAMTDALFARLGEAATYHAGPAGDAVAVTVIVRQPDRTRTAFAPGAKAASVVADLRFSQVALPARNDIVVRTVNGAAQRLRVMEAMLDTVGAVWRLDLELLKP